MNIAVRAAPPPGAAQAGDLYVDLQSRTLWLGVDPAVDPAAFVLISDIVALQEEIADGDAAVTAYVDSKIATRAPTVHTHVSTQITDFNAAVAAVVNTLPTIGFSRGMIAMWSGSLAEIGVGSLAGWSLCDGSNGTPDLRDKFVLGAGSRAVGAGPAANNFNTADGGTHDHTIAATALTISQLPSHNHGANTGTHSADHAHYLSANTGGFSANHTHTVALAAVGTGQGTGPGADVTTPGYGGAFTPTTSGVSSDHYHGLNAWTGGVSANHTHAIPAEGGGQGHTHTIIGGGGIHNHNITGAQMREALPFFALAYIMKL